jgi:hypothetical protein
MDRTITVNSTTSDNPYVLQRTGSMVKRTIVVPTIDNDGRRLDAEIAKIEIELLGLGAAYTVNVSAGVWESPAGIIYRDPALTYMVVTSPAVDAALTERLTAWACWLRQEMLYTDSVVVEVAHAVIEEHPDAL